MLIFRNISKHLIRFDFQLSIEEQFGGIHPLGQRNFHHFARYLVMPALSLSDVQKPSFARSHQASGHTVVIERQHTLCIEYNF